jgi:hypothetical protein
MVRIRSQGIQSQPDRDRETKEYFIYQIMSVAKVYLNQIKVGGEVISMISC